MNYSNEQDDDQIKMLNGRYIMNALSFLNYEATENELLKHITQTGQNLDNEELKRILDYGVSNGFIMKNNNKYLLPSLDDVNQIDGPFSSDSEDSEMVGGGACNRIEETKIRIATQTDGITFTSVDKDKNEVNVALSYGFLEYAKNKLSRGEGGDVMKAMKEVVPAEACESGESATGSDYESATGSSNGSETETEVKDAEGCD